MVNQEMQTASTRENTGFSIVLAPCVSSSLNSGMVFMHMQRVDTNTSEIENREMILANTPD